MASEPAARSEDLISSCRRRRPLGGFASIKLNGRCRRSLPTLPEPQKQHRANSFFENRKNDPDSQSEHIGHNANGKFVCLFAWCLTALSAQIGYIAP